MNDGITVSLSGKIPILKCYNNHFVQCHSRDFPTSYVILSFIPCFTTFYCLDPYFIFKSIIFNIYTSLFGFCYSIQLCTCDCSIGVTAVLEYLKSARECATISYFHCASILNTARPIITGCVIVIDYKEMWSWSSIIINQPRLR